METEIVLQLSALHKKRLKSTIKLMDQSWPNYGDFFIVCIDPMARRVHECLPVSGDIVLCDAASSLDNFATLFFRFLICSPPPLEIGRAHV